jgi:hypothetical protein
MNQNFLTNNEEINRSIEYSVESWLLGPSNLAIQTARGPSDLEEDHLNVEDQNAYRYQAIKSHSIDNAFKVDDSYASSSQISN